MLVVVGSSCGDLCKMSDHGVRWFDDQWTLTATIKRLVTCGIYSRVLSSDDREMDRSCSFAGLDSNGYLGL